MFFINNLFLFLSQEKVGNAPKKAKTAAGICRLMRCVCNDFVIN